MTPLPSDMQALIEELGPLSTDVAAVVEHPDGVWVVTFLDDTQAVLRWCDRPARLETSTQVARFEQPLSADMLEVLLAFNLLSSETRGARMAWEPQERSLHLVRDLPQAECQLGRLQDSLRSLIGTADYWREALMDEPQATQSASTPTNA